MATSKISALVALAVAAITGTDITVIVDDIGGTPTTKKATLADLRTALLGGSNGGFTATDQALVGNVKFSSGGTASADVNTLDAYVEGTWTLVPNTNLTLDAALNVGRYTRVGRLITVMGLMQVTAVSGANAVTVSLPVAAAAFAAGGEQPGVGCVLPFSVTTSGEGLSCSIGNSASVISFYKVVSGGASVTLKNSDLIIGSSLYFTATYVAA